MRSHFFPLSFFLLSVFPPVHSQEEFSILAPSRESRKLLVIRASPGVDGLKLRKTREIGVTFAGRTIAGNRSGTRFYVSGKANSIGENGALVDFDQSGKFLKIRTFTLDRDYSYLSLDRSESFLLGCNYGEGVVDVYALKEDGRTDGRVATLKEGRKAAHCALVSPDNQFLYIPYVKEHNALFQYRFDSKTGQMSPLEPLNAEPPDNTGPRHLAYHPKLPLVYFSEEQGLGVSIYLRNKDGRLTFWKSARAVGDDAPSDGVSSSDILLTPDGRFIFAGIRGHKHDFDFIAGYAVQKDGDLRPIGLTPAEKIPWGMTTSPDGRYVVVTGFGEGILTVYQIGDQGKLNRAAQIQIDKKVSDVVTR